MRSCVVVSTRIVTIRPAIYYMAGHNNSQFNTLMTTSKPQSNRYSNTVIGTLAVDVWAVTFGTARRGLGGATAHLSFFSLYQM